MTTDKFVFFWGGTFSQWAPSDFTIDGVDYNCCEQYMMAKKAMLFNDEHSLKLIMGTRNPMDQKGFGRKVKGFDKAIWENVCREYVYEGNYAKFTQNPKMEVELMATGNREIVEASPEDRIWGIGLTASDPRSRKKEEWLGTNWLGEAIMRVRETIKEDNDLSWMEQKLTNNR